MRKIDPSAVPRRHPGHPSAPKGRAAHVPDPHMPQVSICGKSGILRVDAGPTDWPCKFCDSFEALL